MLIQVTEPLPPWEEEEEQLQSFVSQRQKVMCDVELAIKEQFTGPPGGANVDTTGRLVWPTAVPLLERVQAE